MNEQTGSLREQKQAMDGLFLRLLCVKPLPSSQTVNCWLCAICIQDFRRSVVQEINFPAFHDACLARWKEKSLTLEAKDFLAIVEANHAFNYQLWLAEDRARREDKGYEFVYQAKREIDKCNQARNDRMEAMDTYLYEALSPALIDKCPVHSETPGMMIDRLSILSLKIFHMAIQANRQEVDDAHRQMCKQKYQTLCMQRKILHQCLQTFLEEIRTHRRTFCVYHQFKMYNDPKLNPELYGERP